MIVEVMGVLIFVGMAMIFFVRRQGEKQPVREQREDLKASVEILRQEMQRSGDEVIQRLGGHVEHLEQLIREADEKTHEMDLKMVELQGAQQSLNRQLAEGRALQQHLTLQQQQCQMVYQQMMTMPQMMRPMLPQQAETRMERVDQKQFSEVLNETIRQGEMDAWPQDVYEPSNVHMTEDVMTASVEEAVPVQEALPVDGVSARARALLRDGHSVEEVSKETGLGKGAVELLRQMVQHQFSD